MILTKHVMRAIITNKTEISKSLEYDKKKRKIFENID